MKYGVRVGFAELYGIWLKLKIFIKEFCAKDL
jgi:hypothetical protein